METEKTSILGSGIYLPKNELSSGDFENLIGLSEGFIEERTGIKSRRWSSEEESVEYMAGEAALNAVKNSNVQSIDGVHLCLDIISTQRGIEFSTNIEDRIKENVEVSPNFHVETTANYCPGFIYALNNAFLKVRSRQAENLIVVASTNYRDVINFNDQFNDSFSKKKGFDPRSKEVLFFPLESEEIKFQSPILNSFLWGCGAAAVVVGRSSENQEYFFQTRESKKIRREAFAPGYDIRGDGFAALDGKAISRFAEQEVPIFIEDFLKYSGLKISEIDHFIPHQPNPLILEKLRSSLNIPKNKFYVTCDYLGNMIAASLPATYHIAKSEGKIKSGDKVLFYSLGDSLLTGAGFTFREK